MSKRFLKGQNLMNKLDPTATERLVKSLKDTAPDLAKYVIEFAYGDVMARPGLSLKSREKCIIAALAAMGTAKEELKIHIKKALQIGILKDEICEILIQIAVYAGFPHAINALICADEVFKN